MNQSYGQQPLQRSALFAGAPVTQVLLIANIVIYFLDFAGAGYYSYGRLKDVGAFEMSRCFEGLELWRLLSFQFLHGDGMHLLLNMFVMFMFGRTVEQLLGSRRYLAYYLLCGVAGALFYSLLVVLDVLDSGWLVGASAGIFGILIALVVIAPDMRVMLMFPPIPMSMKTLGMVVIGIAVVKILFSLDNAGGEAGHLGGVIMGWLLLKNPRWLDWTDSQVSARPPRRSTRPTLPPKIRPRTSINLGSDEVDRILDKISAEGFQSLTDEERETLHKHAKQSDDE